MDLETLWYEASPFIYALVGIVALIASPTTIGFISGVLLIAAAATIIRLRWKFRYSLKK